MSSSETSAATKPTKIPKKTPAVSSSKEEKRNPFDNISSSSNATQELVLEDDHGNSDDSDMDAADAAAIHWSMGDLHFEDLSLVDPGEDAPILFAPSIAAQQFIPQKSFKVYLAWYNKYRQYVQDSNFDQGTWHSFLNFFKALTLEKTSAGELRYAPSTLWQAYGALNKISQTEYNFNFNDNREIKQFLKQNSKKHVPKQSETFETAHVNRFLNHREDSTVLLMKTALVVGIYAGARPDELTKFGVKDFKTLENGDVEGTFNEESKTRPAGVDKFILPDDPGNFNSPAKVFSRYKQAACLDELGGRFFRSVDAKTNNFCARVVGKNTLSLFPRFIAKLLGLENWETFTGACYRRTGATLLAGTGASITQMKKFGRWQSSTVAERYVNNNLRTRTDLSKSIYASCGSSSSSSSQPPAPPPPPAVMLPEPVKEFPMAQIPHYMQLDPERENAASKRTIHLTLNF